MARRNAGTTIAEVATAAGVSPATVSRVMNDRFVGEPAIADRVRRVALELDYRPSPLARSLALGRTRTVAFVVPDLSNPAFQEVLSALSKAAARDGYRVLIADSAEHSDDEAQIALDIRHRCDSIVLCAPRMPEERLAAIAPQLAPLVLINRSSDAVDAPSVAVDYAEGIHSLAEHAYAQGHRRFAYLEGPASSMSNSRRLEGLARFTGAHQDVQLERVPAGVSAEDGRRASFAVRDSGATMALAFNDLVAIGLLDGLTELGVAVPQSVSIAGFDDILLARFMSPALTTAAVPHATLGEEAWQRLHALTQGAEPAADLVVTPQLRLRESIAVVTGS